MVSNISMLDWIFIKKETNTNTEQKKLICKKERFFLIQKNLDLKNGNLKVNIRYDQKDFKLLSNSTVNIKDTFLHYKKLLYSFSDVYVLCFNSKLILEEFSRNDKSISCKFVFSDSKNLFKTIFSNCGSKTNIKKTFLFFLLILTTHRNNKQIIIMGCTKFCTFFLISKGI
jgi:hypothetical protein